MFQNTTTSSLIPTVSFWFYKEKPGQSSSKSQSKTEYAPQLTKIGTCFSLGTFWQIYQHLKKPKDFKGDLYIFKKGIQPMWEDPNNRDGGKYSILLKNDSSSLLWEEVVISFCGCVLPYYEEINGVAISTRKPQHSVQIWFRKYDNELVDKMRKELKAFFQIPKEVNMEAILFKKKDALKRRRVPKQN